MPANDVAPRSRADDFLALIQRQSQGKLKVYLGACAGVGKTYQMLVEGNRLLKRGVDVVIGYVEPHARPETTAQIGELEIVPTIDTHYKGVDLHEMDVPAILRRAPTIVLVDELAHTNAPGSKNRKRYEDIEDLLAAGINVISTLNIQHLESLYNVVEGATGVRVKERVPDEFLFRADQIVNIDLPAEDLIERLQAGKIYAADRVAQALQSFFTPGNLDRLRELALSESANFLDRRQRAAPAAPGSPTSDPPEHTAGGVAQVAVALSSGGPDPGTLLRKTARIAAQLNADAWYAVYVQTPGEAPATIDSLVQRQLGETLETAQRMGGVVIRLRGEDIPAALTAFVREYGITHLVIGRPAPRASGWRAWGQRPSLHETLMRELRTTDFVVV